MKNIAQQILRLLIYMVLLTPIMLLAQPICQIQHFSIYNGLGTTICGYLLVYIRLRDMLYNF